MKHEHSHRPAPQEAGEARGKRASDCDAEGEWHGKSDQRPQQKRPVYEADDRIVDQVARVSVPCRSVGVHEQPAQMGVRETTKCVTPPTSAAHVRAMRITFPIRERMVLAMVRNPLDDRTFDCG
jgi:hypothetical protein